MKKQQYEKDARGATIQNGKIIRIPATTDFMFKNLFGVSGKEENLKGLLQAILKIKIENLKIQNAELPRNFKNEKLGILDIRAQLGDGTTAAIEMQIENQKNIGERVTFYICKIYINTIEIGQTYNEASKTIAIAIIDFSYFNRKEYHQIAHLKFEECTDKNEIVEEIIKGKESKTVTDKLEVHIIDLAKFKKMKKPKGELADWLNLIIGNEGEIEMSSQRNKAIAKVNEENKRLSASQKMQAMYLSQQMALYDYNTNMSVARKEGEKIGERRGEKKGERKAMKEVAKRMLKDGIDIEKIEKLTELSRKKIEQL